MSERIPDLQFEFMAGGSLRLEQSAGAGEMMTVLLHPCQIQLIAERAGLIPYRIPERRLAILRERICDLVEDEYFRSDIWKRLCYGSEYLQRLDAIADLAVEFDGGLMPDSNDGGTAS